MKLWFRYTMECYLFSLKNERDPAIHNNVHEFGGQYTKCNKPDIESKKKKKKKNVHDPTHM